MNNRLSDATTSVQSHLAGLIAGWTQSKRLFNIEGDGLVAELLVEKFIAIDSISEPFTVQLTVLTLNAQITLNDLLGKRITLSAALSDGSTKQHTGLIFHAKFLGFDGGFVRLQVTFMPWVEMLRLGSQSRVWQGKSVVEIIDTVLGDAAYSGYAAWRWGEESANGKEDIQAFLALGPNAGVRTYCTQYRETDLAFLSRLLASEGLGYRIEETNDAPAGHRIVFFADSARWPENPTSASAVGGSASNSTAPPPPKNKTPFKASATCAASTQRAPSCCNGTTKPSARWQPDLASDRRSP